MFHRFYCKLFPGSLCDSVSSLFDTRSVFITFTQVLICVHFYDKFIQVLRKADMIRKNAVESILAERDILISVQNPFVVSSTCQNFSGSSNIFFLITAQFF